MIADASALVAIVLREPGHELLRDRLADGPPPGIGAPTLLETRIVLVGRAGDRGSLLLARLIEVSGLQTIPFTDQHADAAFDAFWRYGRGRHPAALNLGDCLTYATARLAAEPLLCVGDDFAQTDLELVALD